jgi:hypothetical protein
MPEPPSDTDTGGGSDYPPAIEAQFLKACNSNGRLSSSGCQCWFDSLKEQYTYPEFIQALSESKNGSPPPEVLSALRECASA